MEDPVNRAADGRLGELLRSLGDLLNRKRRTRKVPLPPRIRHTFRGRLDRLPKMRSRFLNVPRDVLIYRPPEYEAAPDARFPVLYMHDGQNLFDPRTAFIPGHDWRLGETVEALVSASAIEPLLIVAVENAGVDRIHEYTPTRDARKNAGGRADAYGLFLVEELKPFVDWQYRTRPGRENTGMGGSSLGGLVTLHLGLRHPDVFSRLAVLSPSVWWDGEAIVRSVDDLPGKPDLKIWLDTGTHEGASSHLRARRLRAALMRKGWRKGRDLQYLEAKGGEHNELAWAARVGPALKYLYAPAQARRTGFSMQSLRRRQSSTTGAEAS